MLSIFRMTCADGVALLLGEVQLINAVAESSEAEEGDDQLGDAVKEVVSDVCSVVFDYAVEYGFCSLCSDAVLVDDSGEESPP